VTKLHLGCGPLALPGWVNIDNQRYPGVDKVLDLRKGLPYKDVSFVFAEHFIEHLAYDDALKLMREARRVLRDDGVLRLSTPNLDWVWVTHYRLEAPEDQQVAACFYLNRAFHGWGHQFLYNERTLAATLRDAGFANVKRVQYGESEHAELRGLERHEKSTDYGELSHILIVEAWGRGGAAPAYLDGPRGEFRRDVNVR
jgi:predicted SAM-dependent methyltransferase